MLNACEKGKDIKTHQKFIPVKVTDKQWADKLMQGEIFMRPLHDFGIWNKNNSNTDNSVLNNNFRGDIHEGTVSVTTDIQNCELLKGADPGFKEVVKQVSFIDSHEAQYMKIYSLYCLEHDPNTDFFVQPDERMKKFGDTAVIICDFDSFLRRVGQSLIDEYGDIFLFMLDRIRFFDFSETKATSPLFEKNNAYAYQKELRMVFGELEENRFARKIKDGKHFRMVWNLEPKKIQIGDISDIAYVLPIDDFLLLKGFEGKRFRWPVGEGDQKTIFDLMVEDTRKIMKDFNTPILTPLVII